MRAIISYARSLTTKPTAFHSIFLIFLAFFCVLVGVGIGVGGHLDLVLVVDFDVVIGVGVGVGIVCLCVFKWSEVQGKMQRARANHAENSKDTCSPTSSSSLVSCRFFVFVAFLAFV